METRKILLNPKNSIYYFYSIFWVVALLPKTLQVVPVALIAVWAWINRKKREWDIFSKLQGAWLVVYFISIGVNLIQREYQMDRILATANTFCSSVLALVFYLSYLDVEVDRRKLGRICFYNTLVLVGWNIVYHFAPDISFLGRTLGRGDKLYGVETFRFLGFLDYSNLVLFFVLFQLPLALHYLETKNVLFRIGYCVILFAVLMDTNSRSAVIVYSAAIGCYFLFMSDRVFQYYAAHKRACYLAVAAVFLLVLVLFDDQILLILEKILSARAGSNRTRSKIYGQSMTMLMENNPVLGMGIKHKIEGMKYLYGSHSTYLGVLYRTGILGGTIYFLSLLIAVMKILRVPIKTQSDLIFKVIFGGLLALMALEDIDGVIWTVSLFYTSMALLQKKELHKEGG